MSSERRLQDFAFGPVWQPFFEADAIDRPTPRKKTLVEALTTRAPEE